jgi:putative MATE family efflux protein
MTPTAPPRLVAASSVRRQIVTLAAPALLQQGLLLTIQLYDQFLAGQFTRHHQAALTTANYLYWFTTSYAVVVNAGATALVGRFVGGRDLPLACRTLAQSLLLALAFGLAGAALAFAGLPTLIAVLSLEGDSATIALDYLHPLAGLLPFYMVEVGGIACLVGAGDTRTGLKVLAAVAAVNVPLAWGLSQGRWGLPDLGFVGIAWGTGLAHVGGCGLVLATLLRGRFGLKLHVADLAPDRALVARLLRVSIPAAVDSLSVGLFQFAFLGIVNRIGETAASAHGIALRLEGLGYLSGAAFATATAGIVGRALGEGRPDLASRAGWAALGLGGLLMTAMGVLFFVLARPMFELFCPNPDQAAVIEAGVPVLRLVAFAMPGLAGSIILTQALRGAGDTRVPVLFNWVGFLGVRLPLAWLLTDPRGGFEWGLLGAWAAMFVDINLRGVFYLVRFAGGAWKRTRV